MSYEKEIMKKNRRGDTRPDRLDISMIKYFWQASPFSGRRVDSIPKFLRKIDVLKEFSDNQLRILSKYMHFRVFDDGEKVFCQNDLGVGLYLIYSGMIDIVVESSLYHEGPERKSEPAAKHIITLDKFDYFGEIALLQENSIRNASAISRERTQLLGFFKPDLEMLTKHHPVLGAQLIKAVSVIITNRLFSLTREMRELKQKLANMEKLHGKD